MIAGQKPHSFDIFSYCHKPSHKLVANENFQRIFYKLSYSLNYFLKLLDQFTCVFYSPKLSLKVLNIPTEML